MATEAKRPAGFGGHSVQSAQYFVKHSGENKTQLQYVENVLSAEFKRIGASKTKVDVLGVGSGGGLMDAQILTLLQSTLPDVSISVDIVEPSTKLGEHFKALLSKNEHLQKIPFVWHNVTAEDYENEVKANGDMKRFDFIYMIQMFYYFDDCVETIKFLNSLLKENGKLMIIADNGNSGWDFLRRTYRNDLSKSSTPNYVSSGAIFSHLKSLGQKYEERIIPITFDITDCFTEDNEIGELLLDFITAQEHFQQYFTPELRAGILDLLRNKASQYDMAFLLKNLSHDDSQYVKSFQLFRDRSAERVCMLDFIHNILPDILASIGEGTSHLNVIGLGSGAGELDVEMLSELHLKHPGVTVDNEVVEPSSQQIQNYKALVSQKSSLDYIKFTWNNMTASKFVEQLKANKMTKKADFIHMIHMLYYVKDPVATISFFQSLLNKNGKLLIILQSGKSGWQKLRRTLSTQQCDSEISPCVTTGEIKKLLDSRGMSYQDYELLSQFDITECFTEGDEKGELLLDFLTEIKNFRKTASPELKADVLELLRHPDCSVESDGRVIFNNNLGALVLGPHN